MFHKTCIKGVFFSPTAFDDIINELSRIAGVYDMDHHACHLALQSQHVFKGVIGCPFHTSCLGS